MTLTLGPGDRIGPYEIVHVIGTGGMGTVFRACDSQLQRTVAVKVLNDAGEAEHARLLAEARAASALSHPGICTVHEIRSDGGRVCLVLEHVDGVPLRARVPEGGLPAAAIIRYGLQIADTLAYAHERGIVHRDLKSANILVTKEGRTKIIDFGLATRVAAMADEELTRSQPPLVRQAAGTLAYMAPEVLRGEPAGVSSDIWALGVVLYEMAAGRLPFAGQTFYELTAAILHSPAPPLRSTLPASLRTIIVRCLAKEPELRYRTAREVHAALEAVDSDSAVLPVSPGRPASRRAVAWGGVAALIAAIIGAALWWRPSPPPFFGDHQLHRLLASERPVSDPALSPDGTMVVYVAVDEQGQADLYVARVAGGAQVRLTNDSATEMRPRFAPDGERIAFGRRLAGSSQPEIAVIPAFGGSVSVVLTGGNHPEWSPDGGHLVFVRAGPGSASALAVARSDGSDVVELLRSGGVYPFLQHPVWSPDGERIAFVRGRGGAAQEVWLIRSTGGEPQRVSDDPATVFSRHPAFTPDGRFIVHVSNRGGATNIWALPADGRAAIRLTTGTGPDESPTVDRSGRVVFANRRESNELFVARLDAGTVNILARHTPFLWGPAFSPDGQTVAYSQGEIDGSWHLWVTDAIAAAPRRLTSGERGEIYPRWSPDGEFVVYHTWAAPRRVWRVPRNGGPPAPLTPPQLDAALADVSPDGRSIAFAVNDQKVESVHVMPLVAGAAPRSLGRIPSTLPRWSPDGRWIAFAPDLGYSSGIFVMRPDGSEERQLTKTGGWPVWWPDGRRIGFLVLTADGNQEIRTVAVDSAAEARLPIDFEGWNQPFDVARDGRSLVASETRHASSEIWLLQPR